MGSRFPNLAPGWLRPAETAKRKLRDLTEPEWKKILRIINEEENILRSDFPGSTRSTSLDKELQPDWNDIRIGDYIRIERVGLPVRVDKKDEKRKRLIVLIGDISSDIPFSRVLQRLSAQAIGVPLAPVSIIRKVTPSINKDDVRSEINLLGMRYEEMQDAVKKYLDDALLAGWDNVRIIHGHGTGILKKGVRELLKTHPLVIDFFEAPPSEGGGGATIAVFRK
jgi:DNA mismatch repair protein MutS2